MQHGLPRHGHQGAGLVTGQLADTPTRGLPTHTMDNWQTCHPTDWSTCGLDKSRTRQLMDPPAVAVLVVITLIYGHKTLHRSQHVLWSNKHVRLVICYVILCAHYHAFKTKTSTTSGGIHELSSLRVDQ